MAIINSSFYRDSARKILNTIDESPVPVDWAAIDEDELIEVIAQALVDGRTTAMDKKIFSNDEILAIAAKARGCDLDGDTFIIDGIPYWIDLSKGVCKRVENSD